MELPRLWLPHPKTLTFPLLYNENKTLIYNNYVTSIKHLLTL